MFKIGDILIRKIIINFIGQLVLGKKKIDALFNSYTF